MFSILFTRRFALPRFCDSMLHEPKRATKMGNGGREGGGVGGGGVERFIGCQINFSSTFAES